MNQKQSIFILALITVGCIFLYTKYDENKRSEPKVEEVVVYKEKDILSLLGSLDLENKLNKKVVAPTPASQNAATTRINEANESHDYLKKYPQFMDCKKKDGKKWLSGSPQISNFNYAQAAPQASQHMDYLRAVIIYFPIELVQNFQLEFKWLYRSWIEMQKYEPNKWKTDFVVFIENDPTFFKDKKSFLDELNCSFENKRTSKDQKPMCTLINYIALKKRQFQPMKEGVLTKQGNEHVKAKYDYLLSNVNIFSDDANNLNPFYSISKTNLEKYGYVDSILMAFDGYDYFKTAGYDYLIRSDMDVFLTPLFAKWLPDNCNDFYVGRGAYSDDFNRKRLSRIARDLGLEHAGISNLGSTWYSTPQQFRLVSYLTIFSMSYLSQEEFSQPEREGKVGVQLWPQWHYGVLLLYGQNIGLNHLIGSKQLNVVKLENLIDYPSANTDPVDQKLHIHVFHGDDLFSKFSFKAGKYDNMTIDENQVSQIKYYCLKMALEAKRTSNLQLRALFDQQVASKV